MPRNKPPLLSGIRSELDGLSAELAEMTRCHWELARLELASDMRELRRLALGMTVAAALALAALPMAAVALAWWVRGSLGLGFGGWLAVFAALLLAGAATVAHFAWHRFRRRFCGLEETLEELREDLLWVGEWTGSTAASGQPTDPPKADDKPGTQVTSEGDPGAVPTTGDDSDTDATGDGPAR